MDPRVDFTVSSAAIREITRLNDVSVLAQVQEVLAPKKLDAMLAQDLAFILEALYKNTRSAEVGKVLLQFVELAEKKKRTLQWACFTLGNQHVPAPELEALARRHLPAPDDWKVERGALDILTAIGDPRDFGFLAELLRSGKLDDGSSQSAVAALVATGKEKAIPVLQEFVDRNRKTRKTLIAYGLKWQHRTQLTICRRLLLTSRSNGVRTQPREEHQRFACAPSLKKVSSTARGSTKQR
jgi:hypothetical protein